MDNGCLLRWAGRRVKKSWVVWLEKEKEEDPLVFFTLDVSRQVNLERRRGKGEPGQ
jgi:hypothetical protein